jgi:hypothetical protein
MPNLYCTLVHSDFTAYAVIQEIIALSAFGSVKEQALPGHVIIHISFFSSQDKELFLQKIKERLPAVLWQDKS